MTKVLIVDDEQSIRRTLSEILEYEKFEVVEAEDGLECISQLKKEECDVVILDIKMPKMDGMEALERIRELNAEIPVIMISGHATIDTAVEAVKKGAFDFIAKPPDLNRMLITIRNALDRSSLISETKQLKKKVEKKDAKEIVGSSDAVSDIEETIERVAPTEARILVEGENGTGKELVAHWIHQKSQRSDNPLVEVNCAAIPSELIESELFGHEKGAFTSAVKQRIGKFEQADGGTLFLDEIGDMSLSAQAKVLRVMQEKKIVRVGGDEEIEVDVRIIAATNKDLHKEIQKGNFREDLYHRLAVIIIDVPPLEERKEDIPLLVEHFNENICEEYGKSPKKFTDPAIKCLTDIKWTGNIRELRNVVERLIILCGDKIHKKDVEQNVAPAPPVKSRFSDIFERFDDLEEIHDYIEKEYEEYQTEVSNIS